MSVVVRISSRVNGNEYELPCAADPYDGSNVADDWRRFREQYEHYEIASDIADKSQEKRAAVLLTCIGNDAGYDALRAMELDDAESRQKLDPITSA